ncbi:MAG TPA: XdhC family protein [Candidatus Limiplasma sp.]|nr:XdhC family protein [Candidatus Limiplasma sp.]HPS80503.1 XdhC family protein [Candidatus Limiplasma sp.]
MKKLIPVIVEELQACRNIALATVLQSKGSAPRGAGACQLLLQDGRSFGTVGGGVLERRALNEMQALLERVASQANAPASGQTAFSASDGSLRVADRALSSLQEYALTQNEVLSLGMVCGGNVVLLYQVFTPEQSRFFAALLSRLAIGGNLWLARELTESAVTRMIATGGTKPEQILAHGTRLPSDMPPEGLCRRKPIWYAEDGSQPPTVASAQSWFVEPITLESHAYIFGGGHVAQCVAPLLAQLDFSPVVYDDRPEFADPGLFPTASRVVCAPFPEAVKRLSVTTNDEIVIMTRGHVNDLTILTQALRTSAWYIGLIGSRSKIEHTKAMLLAEGFTDADFARVKTPIGLPIGAETPMEIAVSVAAEMIQCRAERTKADGIEG